MAWLSRQGNFIWRPPVLITLAVLVGLGYVAWIDLASYVGIHGRSSVHPPYRVEDLVVGGLASSHKYFLDLPQPPLRIVVADSTVPHVASATARYALSRRIRQAFPRLSNDAIAVMFTNMARRTAVSLSRTEILITHPITPVVFLSAASVDSMSPAGTDADTSFGSEPSVQGILTFSGMGFSPDSTLALVHVTNVREPSERQAWYFMYFKVGEVWSESFYMPGDE